ncbi:MAG: DUF3995 domain-containing protein [Actinomycetota bacterium]|nr:DUF3995 domain-containing protein [Actinomycetota bacterium]
MQRPPRAFVAGYVAAALGLAHAAVSAYWLFGGTGLRDTVGGSVKDWGRRRSSSTIVALAALVAVKSVVALSGPVFAAGCADGGRSSIALDEPRRRGQSVGCAPSSWSCTAAFLTVGGVAVQLGIVDAAEDADETALAWHAFLWDPWFLVWGIALGVALQWSRERGAMVMA